MKKILFTLLFAVMTIPSFAQRQMVFTNKDMMYSLTGSFVPNTSYLQKFAPTDASYLYSATMPSFTFQGAIPLVSKNWGTIGVGVFAGFSQIQGVDKESKDVTLKFYMNPLGVHLSYHYTLLTNLDLYVQGGVGGNFLGALLGIRRKTEEGWEKNNSWTSYPDFKSTLYFAEVGAIYMITNNFGIRASADYGLNYVSAGLVLKIQDRKRNMFYGPTERW